MNNMVQIYQYLHKELYLVLWLSTTVISTTRYLTWYEGALEFHAQVTDTGAGSGVVEGNRTTSGDYGAGGKGPGELG